MLIVQELIFPCCSTGKVSLSSGKCLGLLALNCLWLYVEGIKHPF